jgi:hypothetical protein
VKLLSLVSSALLLTSCAAAPIRDQGLAAACVAQNYLKVNGFLDSPVSDPTTIELGLWDRLTFEKGGVMDWQQLLANRRGRYSHRLYGVESLEAGNFLVVYQIADTFSCVSVLKETLRAHLNEAPCRPSNKVMRVKEESLSCK